MSRSASIICIVLKADMSFQGLLPTCHKWAPSDLKTLCQQFDSRYLWPYSLPTHNRATGVYFFRRLRPCPDSQHFGMIITSYDECPCEHDFPNSRGGARGNSDCSMAAGRLNSRLCRPVTELTGKQPQRSPESFELTTVGSCNCTTPGSSVSLSGIMTIPLT